MIMINSLQSLSWSFYTLIQPYKKKKIMIAFAYSFSRISCDDVKNVKNGHAKNFAPF